MAGHQAGDFKPRHFVSGHVAYLPENVIPFMISQDLGGLALLPEQRRKLLHAAVVKPQFYGKDIPPRAIRVHPERESIELAPVLVADCASHSGTAPTAPVLGPGHIKSGGHPHPQRLTALARLLPR